MSKEINNTQYRKNAIKEMLKMLHEGKDLEEVKAVFNKTFDSVSASEISQVEQALIDEGMPVEEVQKLCDVHSAVFKGSIAQIHQPPVQTDIPGHPVWVIKEENRAIEKVVNQELLPAIERAEKDFNDAKPELISVLNRLELIKNHYVRKENLFFPYMEKYGITGPPQVMWSVDDEIRKDISTAIKAVQQSKDGAPAKLAARKAANGILEMIFKEENILIPMLLETLSQEEWGKIAEEQPSLGYTLIPEPPKWSPEPTQKAHNSAVQAPSTDTGTMALPTGNLSMQELTGILNLLPVDVTFVDKDGLVKYFSDNAERIFPRTKAVLGREVKNCHPPASVHIVEKILADFESGKKDEESFWIEMRGSFVYIRYYAVRNPDGKFLGTLEVTQNVTDIRALTGEKRLMSE